MHSSLPSPASGDPVNCYSLSPCELSSAVGFNKPWHQCKSVITEKKVQIGPCLSQGFRWQKPQGAILNLFYQLAAVKYLRI